MKAIATSPSARSPGWRRRASRTAWVLLTVAEALGATWCALALRIDASVSTGLVVAFAAFSAGLILFVRPRWVGHAAFLILFAAILVWWLGLEPSNDRSWLADVSRPPRMEIQGDQLVVHDLRDFDYRSDEDFTPRWEERRYDLSHLVGVDILLSDWGAPAIVHTMVSWEFSDAPPLAISIETRKEVGETYSAVRGFFRQFELFYAVADERDLIRVRTNCRGERVRLYRLNVPVPVARALLLGYAERVDHLASEPAWYNALTSNCTTNIRLHVGELGLAHRLNWRLYANKYSDELLYQRGALDTSLPFEELHRRSDITDAARAAGNDPDFSRRIREGLPPRK